jgi:hypothetical protein
MGRLQNLGRSPVRLALVEDRTRAGSDGSGLFAGVDTLTGALARPAGSDAAALLALRARSAGADVSRNALAHLDRAIAVATGVVCDARADDDHVVAGQRVAVTLECWNSGAEPRTVTASLRATRGFTVQGQLPATWHLEPGALGTTQVTAAVAADAPLTVPYFRLPASGAEYYDWSSAPPQVRGEPFGEPELTGTFLIEGSAGSEREVTLRLNDQARGEVRRPVTVVPRVDVALEPSTEVWPAGDARPRQFTVTLTHGARDTTVGTVTLAAPSGRATVRPQSFRLTREDERETFTFEVRQAGAGTSGALQIRAAARDAAGRRYETGVVTVDYPHIRPRAYARPAVAVVRVAPLALPRLARIGYVRGAADRVPEALRSVGLPITILDAATLTSGDLSRFSAIVIGPRAYETDSALVEANSRVLEYARRGGRVVVQYQQQRYFEGGFAPYQLTVGGPASSPGLPPVSHDRVTDETAPVRILAPTNPAVLVPNRLTAADWEGWVQERGLYFARSWDPAFRPLLETHDPGEGPLEGGLLVARVGRGSYVYTGLSFFRQLPAGVPGAFRLFANLLAQ